MVHCVLRVVHINQIIQNFLQHVVEYSHWLHVLFADARGLHVCTVYVCMYVRTFMFAQNLTACHGGAMKMYKCKKELLFNNNV